MSELFLISHVKQILGVMALVASSFCEISFIVNKEFCTIGFSRGFEFLSYSSIVCFLR